MALDISQVALLEIVIRARNEATAALRGAAADATGLQASLASAGKAMLTAGSGLGLVTAGLATGMGLLVKQASDYQQTLQNVQGNTTLTTADMKVMHDAILALGEQSGASFSQLADAFMHTTNVGFSMADALSIVRAGMESAVASGSDVGQVVNTLATAMREFNLPASEAAKVMDELHVAAASGNATLEQFVEGAAKAHAMASALHMPLEQIDAAFVAMTRHGFDVATSSTYLTGMLAKMAGVSGQSLAALQALSAETGINLVADFQHVGQQGYSLTKVITDLRAALEAVPAGARLSAAQIKELGAAALAQGQTQKEANAIMKAASGAMGGQVAELFRLIPAMRGGLAAMVLTGAGFNDLTYATQQTTAAINGQIIPAMGTASPTATAYAEALKTVHNQMALLERNIQGTAIVLGEAFLPQVNQLLTTVGPVIKQFGDWAKAHADVIAHVLPLVTAVAGLGAVALLVGGTIALFAAALSPVVITVVALFAAVGLLTAAFTSHNTAVKALTFVLGAAAGVLVGYRIAATAVAFVSGVVRTATLAWVAAQWLLNFALAANPIGLVIVGVAALTAGLVWAYQNVKPFHDAVLALWNALGGLQGVIAVLLSGTMAPFTLAFRLAYDHISAFRAIVDTLTSALGTAFGPMLHTIADAFRTTLGGAIAWVTGKLSDFFELLRHIPGITLPALPPGLAPLVPSAPAVVGGAFGAAASGAAASGASGARPAPTQGAPTATFGATQVPRGAPEATFAHPVPTAQEAFRYATTPAVAVGGAALQSAQQAVAQERAIQVTVALQAAQRQAIAVGGAGMQAAAMAPIIHLPSPPAAPSTTPNAAFGTGNQTQVNITVQVQSGAVQVNGPGARTPSIRDLGLKLGRQVADALDVFAKSEMTVTPSAGALLPGAR